MGAPDAQGVYKYTEDDLAAPGAGFSEMLNKAPDSISDQLAGIRDDIDDLAGGVSSRRFVVPFHHAGALTVAQGEPLRNMAGRDLTIDVMHVHLKTASSSGAVQVDLEVGGVSRLSAALSLGVGVQDADATPAVGTTLWPDGTDLTLDVDAAGTGAAGLTAGVWVH